MKKQNNELSNHSVTIKFFESILDVMAKNSSKNYSIIVLNKIKSELLSGYPFFRHVQFSDKGEIIVEESINEVNKNTIGKFFTTIINYMGPNLLKIMVIEELDQKTLRYLKIIGVKLDRI